MALPLASLAGDLGATSILDLPEDLPCIPPRREAATRRTLTEFAAADEAALTREHLRSTAVTAAVAALLTLLAVVGSLALVV